MTRFDFLAPTTTRMSRFSPRYMCLILVLGSVVALCLSGCAPQAAPSEPSTNNDDASAATLQGDFTFSADADCAICHTTESDSLVESTCPASNHATQACTTCHSDTQGLSTAHEGVAYGDTMPKRLKSTAIDETACTNEACHGSVEELAETTAASTILTDSEGTVANPHALPEVEDHETLDCGSCHDMHASDDIAETAPKACQSCHHLGVYECYTCHD